MTSGFCSVIPRFALARLISLFWPVPAVKVVSGVDAGVCAPIDIASMLALGVEDSTVTHIRSVGPNAGNIRLSISDVIRSRVGAEFKASGSVLIISAVAP